MHSYRLPNGFDNCWCTFHGRQWFSNLRNHCLILRAACANDFPTFAAMVGRCCGWLAGWSRDGRANVFESRKSMAAGPQRCKRALVVNSWRVAVEGQRTGILTANGQLRSWRILLVLIQTKENLWKQKKAGPARKKNHTRKQNQNSFICFCFATAVGLMETCQDIFSTSLNTWTIHNET